MPPSPTLALADPILGYAARHPEMWGDLPSCPCGADPDCPVCAGSGALTPEPEPSMEEADA